MSAMSSSPPGMPALATATITLTSMGEYPPSSDRVSMGGGSGTGSGGRAFSRFLNASCETPISRARERMATPPRTLAAASKTAASLSFVTSARALLLSTILSRVNHVRQSLLSARHHTVISRNRRIDVPPSLIRKLGSLVLPPPLQLPSVALATSRLLVYPWIFEAEIRVGAPLPPIGSHSMPRVPPLVELRHGCPGRSSNHDTSTRTSMS